MKGFVLRAAAAIGISLVAALLGALVTTSMEASTDTHAQQINGK